jgi:hypothetical protein
MDVTAKTALPVNQGVTCITNNARVQSGNITNGDTASYCIQLIAGIPTNPSGVPVNGSQPTTKGGTPVYEPQPVTTVPKTGPETLALIGLLPTGAFGYYLRKKSK